MKKNIFGPVMICLAAAAVLSCGPVCGSQAYSGRSIVLSGGRLIDGNGGAPMEDAEVVIRGDRIAAVGPRGTVPIPARATVLDLRGRTVLPGFMNVHAHHTHIVSNMLEWGREGVTTIRDLVSLEWGLYVSGKNYLAQNAGDPRLPRALFAGLCWGAWLCLGEQVSTPQPGNNRPLERFATLAALVLLLTVFGGLSPAS